MWIVVNLLIVVFDSYGRNGEDLDLNNILREEKSLKISMKDEEKTCKSFCTKWYVLYAVFCARPHHFLLIVENYNQVNAPTLPFTLVLVLPVPSSLDLLENVNCQKK